MSHRVIFLSLFALVCHFFALSAVDLATGAVTFSPGALDESMGVPMLSSKSSPLNGVGRGAQLACPCKEGG